MNCWQYLNSASRSSSPDYHPIEHYYPTLEVALGTPLSLLGHEQTHNHLFNSHFIRNIKSVVDFVAHFFVSCL